MIDRILKAFIVISLCLFFKSFTYAANVEGSITGNVTWSIAGSPYIVTGDLTIQNGATLTIAAGVQVFFLTASHEMFVYGQLNSLGTVGSKVIIQGDVGVNGSSIVIMPGGNANLQHTRFNRMGPDNFYDGAMEIRANASVTLNYVEFLNTMTYGLDILKDALVTMSNCTFQNSGWADIHAHPNAVGLFQSSNSLTSIFLEDGGFSDVVVLPFAGAGSKYITTGDITVLSGGQMTLNSGVELQLRRSDEIFVYGDFVAIGASANPVLVRGVSGDYGAAVVAFAGSNFDLMHTTFDSTGADGFYDGAIQVRGGATANFNNVSFNNSETRGLYLLEDAIVSMDNCAFQNNAWQDIFAHANAVGLFENTNTLESIYLSDYAVSDSAFLSLAGAGVEYITTGDLTVLSAGTMYCDPGVEIRFRRNDEFFIYGKFDAVGTSLNPVRLRNVTGDYGSSIIAYDGAAMKFEHAVFDSMGADGFYDGAIQVRGGATVDLNEVSFSNSETRGLYLLENAIVSMDNCAFQNNAWQDIFAHANAVGLFENTNTLESIYLSDYAVSDSAFLSLAGAGAEYITTGDLTVLSAGTMYCDPGVEIRFRRNDEFFIYGKFDAVGTSLNPVRLRNVTGDYGSSIIAYDGAAMKLEHAVFDSMGADGFYDGAIQVRGGAIVDLNEVSFNNSETRGLYLLRNADVTMANCSFSSNGWQDIHAHPDVVGDFANNNSLDEIWLDNTTMYGNSTWPDAGAGSRYYIEGDLTVYDTATLTIAPSVEIIMPNYYTEIFVNGHIEAVGTTSERITFRSADAASYGAAIYINTQGSGLFKEVDFNRMGADYTYDGALYIRSSNVTISNCAFRDCETSGILLTNSATPNMSYLDFINNNTGLRVYSGASKIEHSNFMNTTYGVNNTGADTVDARNNYWGHSSGPYHPSLNASGLGDEVSNRVLFDPWAQDEVDKPLYCDDGVITLPTGPIPAGSYVAQYILTAKSTSVAPNSNLFSAGSTIELQAGFEIQLGAEFEAVIRDCIME